MILKLRMPVLYLCLCLLGLSTSIVQAGIASISGDVEIIAPPFSVQEGAVESTSVARLIPEREGVLLLSNLAVDITSSGVFNEAIDLTPGSVSAGTLVNSYLLHADSPGASLFEGTIVFAEEILGVIITQGNLQASHPIVGSLSTTYPVDGSLDASRAPLTLDQGLDELTVILPGTLIFHLDRTFSNKTYDHVRVITAVPEPSSLALLAIGALTIGIAHRRRRHRRASGQSS